MATMGDQLGVVVVHFHRERDLTRLLDELTGVHGIPADRILVVDNGSDAGALDDVRARLSVRWIELDNPGYGAAVNAGIRALDGVEQVLVLTHEVRLDIGSIERLSRALTLDAGVGLAGPVMLDTRDGRIWSAGGLSSRVRALPFHRAAKAELIDSGDLDAEWLDGSCFLVRRRDFLEWGGLDDRFFLYFEDVDLGWRLQERGVAVRVVGSAVAWQSPGGHLDQFYATRNALWLFRKHRRWLAFGLYAIESCARLTLGSVLKPRGVPLRQAKRWAGLREGLSRPPYSS